MLGLKNFQELLNSSETLRPSKSGLVDELKKNSRAWSASLSMKLEEEQFNELTNVLSELRLVAMSNEERLELMNQVYLSVERVIAQLHQHYIYETSVISDRQYNFVNQVKSLYFMSILVYQDILDKQSNQLDSSNVKFKIIKGANHNKEALIAIYRISNIYLNLMMEQSITYQRVPQLYWAQLNKLYKSVLLKDWHHVNLNRYLSVENRIALDDIYRQACLHSLLGLASFRRQDIIGVHKLLPFWSQQIRLTQEANPELRLFVDLNEASPPINLSPHSKVNPYESDRLCVFLDLSSFENYLKHITKLSTSNPKMSTQIRLAKIAWHTLQIKTGRREERHVSYDTAIVVSGFSHIHYYMAGKQPLTKLIHHHKLPRVHLPLYDTGPKNGRKNASFKVQIMDTSNTGCRFKWNTDQSISNVEENNEETTSLQVLSLFAMQIKPSESASKQHGSTRVERRLGWQIGLVRWIETQDGVLEAGGRIIGFSATACGLRLENKDERSQVFVPSLLLAGEEKLNTKTTLLVPRHHFRLGDKVILRIGSDQTLLKLQYVLMSSDDFEQYEIMRMT